MAQSLALSSSNKNSEKLNQAGFNFPPELSFQFIYGSMGWYDGFLLLRVSCIFDADQKSKFSK